MDVVTATKLAGVGLSLVAGGITKHRTKVNHKIVGPAQNGGVAAVVMLASALAGPEHRLDLVDWAQVWTATETIYNGAKSAAVGLKWLAGRLRRLL